MMENRDAALRSEGDCEKVSEIFNRVPVADAEISGGDVVRDDSDTMKVRQFLQWLEENGANLSALRIVTGEDLRGIYACKPLMPGQLVMHIPLSLMLTKEVARKSATGQLIRTHAADVTDYGFMAAFLLEIKREGGTWKPYVDVIPEKFPDHPLFFSQSELNYLKGSYILPELIDQRNWLMYEYKQVVACLPRGYAFSSQEYAWARCAIMTRAYTVTINSQSTIALVPFADMFNHAPETSIVWTSESTYGFSVFTESKIDPGVQLYESYGKRCNGKLFVHHGFCVDNNPHNQTEIEVPSLLPAHPFYVYTKNLAGERDEMRVFKVPGKYDDPASRAMFSLLRLAPLEDMPGIYRTMAGGAQVHSVPPISRVNELAALNALASACRRGLSRFETSFEEDEALLNGDTLPRRLRHAVIVRRGEKAILRYFLDLANAAIPFLENPSSEPNYYVDQHPLYASYFNEIAHIMRERK